MIPDIAEFGRHWRDVYDTVVAADHVARGDAAGVAFLRDRAAGGPALELGIGTGRLALPLAEAGIGVFGIEASVEMVERLREKPGGDSIDVKIGDMAEPAFPEGMFRLIFCVYSTFFHLRSQQAQLRCMGSAASQLAEDGVFVVEVFVPDRSRFTNDQHAETVAITPESLTLDFATHDGVAQTIESTRVLCDARRTRLLPLTLRYAFPSELDLMARLAGLRLRERFGGWNGESFDARSRWHVSVYEKPRRA